MNDILQNPEVQKLMPYLIGAFFLQIALWLLLANSVRKALLLIKKENRCILPSQVWFIALPIFNIYWNYVVVRRFVDSLNNEFYDRKVAVDEDPTKKEGYLYVGTYISACFPLPVFINFVVSIATFITFFMYWFKVIEYTKVLKSSVQKEEEIES